MPAAFFEHALTFTSTPVKDGQSLLLMDANDFPLELANSHVLLSPFEQHILQKRKRPQAKKEYVATRLLLKFLVKQHLPQLKDMPLSDISSEFDNEQSKLIVHIDGHASIPCCLSHSHGFVGAALNVDNLTFGFDIEKINPERPFVKLAKHFYHQDEVTLISDIQHSASRFYRIWTLKEALAKATSQPIAKLLSPNVFAQIAQHQLKAKSGVYEGYDISVMAPQHSDWQCAVVNLEQLSGLF